MPSCDFIVDLNVAVVHDAVRATPSCDLQGLLLEGSVVRSGDLPTMLKAGYTRCPYCLRAPVVSGFC